MIQKFEHVKYIPLPILYLDSEQRVHIDLIRFSNEPLFLLCFNSYIGSSDRLNLTEKVINYILDNNIGTYCNFIFLVDSCNFLKDSNNKDCNNISDWVDVYFNNINPKILLEHI